MAPVVSGFGLFLKVSPLTHPPGMVDIDENMSHATIPSRYGAPPSQEENVELPGDWATE